MGKINKTFSITDEYHEIFEERRKELGMTVTAYFEHLIDTEHKKAIAATPVEIVKENPEHLKKIEELQTEVVEKQKTITKNAEEFEQLKSEKEQLEAQFNDLIPVATVPANGTVLILDPLNVQILNYVAIREGKKRKQEWTISDVVNYFIHARFEKGTLNGDISSVPDHIIDQMRKELENV